MTDSSDSSKKTPSFRRGGGRKRVRPGGDSLVDTGPLEAGGRPFPLVVRPTVDGLDPIAWAGDHREWIEERLVRHGALLFRGFDLPTVESFQSFIRAGAGDPLPYTERSSPRSKVQGNIYTSTDYPPEREIFLHNEQSYNRTFPRKIAFYCAVAAEEGGATPIADSRRVFERVDPAVRRRMAEQGYVYQRNFGAGFGLSWQDAFQTDERDRVEAYGRDNDIAMEWLDQGRLRTRQVRPAVARHPVSGELTWFNHATFFHLSTLEDDVAQRLGESFAMEDLPNQTFWGDGTPFEAETMAALQAIYRDETVRFDWRPGDVLLLDNMLAAHGREPFEGPRKVVVSMATPVAWDDVKVERLEEAS